MVVDSIGEGTYAAIPAARARTVMKETDFMMRWNGSGYLKTKEWCGVVWYKIESR